MPTASAHRWVLALAAACAVGCDDSGPRFELDASLHAASGLTAQQSASVEASLIDLFGTPDDPSLPDELPEFAGWLSIESLRQASGPVISHTPGVTQGLFRRHCARCHGVTGDGRGPTALYQAPYPRDFRRGVFKWKSTYREAPPTRTDLHAVLERGVPGTAMPSFALLSAEEREILSQYVQYLAVRGQTERLLVGFIDDELPSGEALALIGEFREEWLAEYLGPLVAGWTGADQQVVAIPAANSADTPEQVAAGRVLFHGEKAGCYKCHGPEGQGGAVAEKDYDLDYDDWSRARLRRGTSPAASRMLSGDLPVRPAIPLGLIGSTLHGGSAPGDLFRRLHQGVAGTPMPAVGGLSAGSTGALTDEEIASLAAYTRTLLARPLTEAPAGGGASEPLAISP